MRDNCCFSDSFKSSNGLLNTGLTSGSCGGGTPADSSNNSWESWIACIFPSLLSFLSPSITLLWFSDQ